MLHKLQLDKSYSAYKALILPGFIISAYLLMSFYIHSDYLTGNLNVYLGILIAPYVFIVRDKGKYSLRFLIVAILLGILTILFPMRSLYFLCIAFAILFLVETCIGKLNSAAIIFIILLSPVFEFLNSFFGVPARLMLSEIVGRMLETVGYHIKVMGNVILLNGIEYSVDAACIGLNMLITSYVLGLFIISYYERLKAIKLTFFSLIIALVTIGLLNLISNLVRITTLVIFNIGPENVWHELIGLLCFVIYVIVPFVVIAAFLYKKFSRPVGKASDTSILKLSRLSYLNVPLAFAIIIVGFNLKKHPVQTPVNFIYTVPGYTKKVLESGVVKFEKKNALVYVKPIMAFYRTEHSPMVCWTNTGYKFNRIEKKTINNTKLYIGEMSKQGSIVYASWWFDNGKYRTIDQLDWRWRALKGENNFYLVNVNSTDKRKLIEETKQLLNNNIFNNYAVK